MKAHLPIDPAAREQLSTLSGTRSAGVAAIGIVDDNLDPPFMESLVECLRERFPETEVRVWPKPVGTAPAPESLIDEMAEEVQLALAGIGL
jgi:hypothetical protein